MSLPAGAESSTLFFLLLLIIWDLTSLPDPSIDFVQLETFDQLVTSITSQNLTNRFDSHYDTIIDDDSTSYEQPECPIDEGRLKYFDDLVLETWLSYHHVEHGGHFKPIGCVPKQRVAIIVPHRGRQEHLERFLLYVHQFLPDQMIDYKVFVIEQKNHNQFSGTKLLNIGAIKIMEIEPSINCFIFHEADLIPLDQRNLYMCSAMPRHLSASVGSSRYHLTYPRLFGGVISMTRTQYGRINGLSGNLFDARRSDEETLDRIVANGLKVERSPLNLGTYITTNSQWANRNQYPYQNRRRRDFSVSSLSRRTILAIREVSIEVELKQLYTHIKCGPHRRRFSPLPVDGSNQTRVVSATVDARS